MHVTLLTVTRMAPRSPIRAVVFDAFGTLVHITRALQPYRAVVANSVIDKATFRQHVLTTNCSFRDLAIDVEPGMEAATLELFEAALANEVASVVAYDDAAPALTRFRRAGLRLAICSNLATPYAAPVLALLPGPWDALVWSFEIGRAKPDERIYQLTCQALSLPPAQVLMVGDTFTADVEGPQHAGMQARWLRREVEINTLGHSVRTLADLADELLGPEISDSK